MERDSIENLKIRYQNLKPGITLKLKGKGYASFDEPWNNQYPILDKEMPSKYMSMYRYLVESTKNNPNSIALVYNRKGKKENVTFAKLKENIDKAAKSFKMLNIKAGDIVPVISLTTPEVIYSFYALNKIGAIPLMFDIRKGPSEYIKQLNAVDAKTIVVADFILKKLKKIMPNTMVENAVELPFIKDMKLSEILKSVIGSKTSSKKSEKIEINNESKALEISSWDKFIKKGDALFAKEEDIEAPYEKNKPGLMILTSGTSGAPKAVIHASETVNSMPQKYYKTGTFDAKVGERMLTIMPPFLMYAVPLTFQTALTNNVTLVILPQSNKEKLLKAVNKYKPEYFIGSISHFYQLLDADDLSFAKYYGCGGDKVNKQVETKLKEQLRELGMNTVFIGYGATELGGSSATQTANHNAVSTVGLPLYGSKAIVVDPKTYEELPYEQEGLLCMQTDTMMLEYFNNEEKTNQVFARDKDGNTYFVTGDLGVIHKNGELSVIGRIKPRAALFTGHKFSPDNINEVLLKHPDIEDAVTVAQPNTYNTIEKGSNDFQGSWPHSYIILNQEDTSDVQEKINEISEFCLRELGKEDVPFFYTVVKKEDGFKLTDNGKVDFRYYEKQLVYINEGGAISNSDNGILVPDVTTLQRDANIIIGASKEKKLKKIFKR